MFLAIGSDLLMFLAIGLTWDSGFIFSYFLMVFWWRTASIDCSNRVAPRGIQSETLSGWLSNERRSIIQQ